MVVDSTRLVTLTHGLIALAIITAATVLLALHDISEPTALALYGAGLALVGGATNTLLALKVPTPDQSPPPIPTSPPQP